MAFIPTLDTDTKWEFVDNEKNAFGALRDGERWYSLYVDATDKVHEVELFVGTVEYANGRNIMWIESFRIVSCNGPKQEIVTSDYAREALNLWKYSPAGDCTISQEFLDRTTGARRWAVVVERHSGRVFSQAVTEEKEEKE